MKHYLLWIAYKIRDRKGYDNFYTMNAIMDGRMDVPEDLSMIKKVIFNNPATIVIWADGTKTVVKRQKGDRYDKEKGLAMAFVKRTMGLKEFYKAMEEAEE